MILNQIFQNTIEGLKDITGQSLAIIDVEGRILASTISQKDDFAANAKSFFDSLADSREINGYQFFKIYDEMQLGYILVAEGDSKDAFTFGKVAAFQIQSLVIAYKERFDKDNFVKNLLLDNLLLVDIYNRCQKLHIEPKADRVVFMIDGEIESEKNPLEILKKIIADTGLDFVTAVDEKYFIVIKTLENNQGPDQVAKMAEKLQKHTAKAFKKEGIRVSYGSIVKEIREVSKSYKEAKLALDVGRIFFEERNVIAYATLGIGRIIYQLPLPLCKMFITEIFEGKNPDEFDEETISTINKFFENSLNVSETSRQLFIHRNTLVYRLDKIQKTTGLDLRVFEDAITFKIALMVVKYMKYIEEYQF